MLLFVCEIIHMINAIVKKKGHNFAFLQYNAITVIEKYDQNNCDATGTAKRTQHIHTVLH